MNDAIKRAFREVREERSPEYVICDPDLNERFVAAAKAFGISDCDAIINSCLLNLRKQNGLKDYPTSRRKKPDPNRHRYLNAVLNAVRLVERQFGRNVDDVICDPDARSQFDALIQFLSAGTSPFEARYAALSLRKSNKLKPEPVGQVIHAVASKALALSDLETQMFQIPKKPGVYIFFNQEVTMYAGKADNLRQRIQDHISTWTFREIIKQIKAKGLPAAHLVYHELPVTISARELAAYETELIRSRQPAHNRAGTSADKVGNQ